MHSNPNQPLCGLITLRRRMHHTVDHVAQGLGHMGVGPIQFRYEFDVGLARFPEGGQIRDRRFEPELGS